MHPILFNFGAITDLHLRRVGRHGRAAQPCGMRRRQAPRAGLDPDKVWNLGIYLVLVALLVAKIWLML